MQKLLIPLLMIISFNLHALLEVSLDGTKLYTEIQAAITEAVAGDTILVHPGTYYENLDLSNSANLSLISLEATTNDSIYISQTIIDGSLAENSVILLNGRNSQFLVRGFTITGGSGWTGAKFTFGGGVLVYFGHLSLINSVVEYNCADKGGGIAVLETGGFFFSGTTLRNNVAYYGGGGLIIGSSSSSQPEIEFDQINRSSIYDNYSRAGTDILWYIHFGGSCEIYLRKFTVANPDRYYIEHYDPFIGNSSPDEYTPYSVIDIEEGIHQLVDADLYVANVGDDSNSGLTPGDPLRTTYKAFQMIKSNPESPRTVYLGAEDYQSTAHGFNNIPIAVKSYTTLTGISPEETKISIEGTNDYGSVGVINCINMFSHNVTIKNLTLTNTNGSGIATSIITNLRLENLIIENCYGYMDPVFNLQSTKPSSTVSIKNVIIRNNITGGNAPTAGYIKGSEILIDNLVVENNHNQYGYNPTVGILEIVASSKLVVNNSKFINNRNETGSGGGALFRLWDSGHFDDVDIIFDNCLFTNNYNGGDSRNFRLHGEHVIINNCSIVNNMGGNNYTLTLSSNSDTKLYNTIIANNNQFYDISYYNSLEIDHCLFSSTDNIAWNNGPVEAVFGENNIYGADPLFAGTDPSDPTYYMLAGDVTNGYSPAIDAGSRDFNFMPDWYELQIFDLNGDPRICGDYLDIGCYEYQGYILDNEIETVTDKFTATNYPNPFNPETTIEFNNPVQGEVNINIYNLKGQLVKSLLQDNLTQGVHKVAWQGTDSNNRQVASGVYFYRVTNSNRGSITKKIILMK